MRSYIYTSRYGLVDSERLITTDRPTLSYYITGDAVRSSSRRLAVDQPAALGFLLKNKFEAAHPRDVRWREADRFELVCTDHNL